MSENPYHEQIGEAWKAHRNGFQDNAIDQFRKVIDQDPNNIDALYGLALAEKAAGHTDTARDVLSHLEGLLKDLTESETQNSRPERHFMLYNMVQRILAQL